MFRGVYSAIYAAVAALTWWVLQHWDQLQVSIAEYKNLALPAMLAELGLLFRMSNPLAQVVIEKIPFFSRMLRKLLTGKDFIEGDWPLVVVDMQRGEPIYFGFLSIDFRDGQLYVYGDDWHTDGNHAMAFQSVQSLYRNRMLQYWYEQGQSLHSAEMRGYTEMYFFPMQGAAKRHAGKFLDVHHTSDIRFYATKLHYKRFERRYGPDDVSKKLEAAHQLWIELQPKLPMLRERAISADFI